MIVYHCRWPVANIMGVNNTRIIVNNSIVSMTNHIRSTLMVAIMTAVVSSVQNAANLVHSEYVS